MRSRAATLSSRVTHHENETHGRSEFSYEESCFLDCCRGPCRRSRRGCLRDTRRRTNAGFGWCGGVAQFCSVEQQGAAREGCPRQLLDLLVHQQPPGAAVHEGLGGKI